MHSSPAFSQVEVERFFPSAVSVGETAELKIEGKVPNWPPAVRCDREDVVVTPAKESGTLAVQVAEDAPLGIAWIRILDKTSVSRAVPLFIEHESTRSETEPNDRWSDLQKAMELPTQVAGRLAKNGDVDAYWVQLKAGQTFVASLRANDILGSPMDAVLQLVDRRGNVIAQADDTRGIDPQLVYRSDEAADLMIRVFAFPETPTSTIGYAGGSSFVYLLRISNGPMLDHALPLLINEQGKRRSQAFGWNLSGANGTMRWSSQRHATSSLSGIGGWQWHGVAPESAVHVFDDDTNDADPSKASADRLPVVFSGHLSVPGETDRFRFRVDAGQRYSATVHSRQFGFEVDSVLRLTDAKTGKELKRNDDRSRGQYDASIEFKADQDQMVELEISDLVDNHGQRAAYSIAVEQVKPTFELKALTDRFSVEVGSEIEIPIAINRIAGEDSTIHVTAMDLPPGATSNVVESEAKGDSAKVGKLKIMTTAASQGQHTFRIVGFRVNDRGEPNGPRIETTYEHSKWFRRSDFWLVVTPPSQP